MRGLLAIAVSVLVALVAMPMPAHGDEPREAPGASNYDAELATELGADERGMRRYVLVILKSGSTPVPEGPERSAMFAGHFANIERLSKAGKLALAGPFFQNELGWRGLYVFAVDDIDEARQLTETDPVIVHGEMVAEYHPWYGTAALMKISDLHQHLVPPAAD